MEKEIIDLLKLDIKNLQEEKRWQNKRIYQLQGENKELALRLQRLELVVASLSEGKVL